MPVVLATVIMRGIEDDMPTDNNADPEVGTIGRLFCATDTNYVYRDNGTTWNLIRTFPSAHSHEAASLDNFESAVVDAVQGAPLNTLALPTGPVDMNSQVVIAVGTPTSGDHATNKTYVDGGLSALSSGLTSSLQGYANGVGSASNGYTDSQVVPLEARVDTLEAAGGSDRIFDVLFTEDGEVILLEDGSIATVRL